MHKYQKIKFFSGVLIAAFAVTLFLSGCHHPVKDFPENHPGAWTATDVETMLGGSDPLEPWNRSMFSCTDFLMNYVADPVGRVYTTIFPRPFIEHFNNLCVNLEYPARAVSTLLRAEWGAAGDETLRFLINTTIGCGTKLVPYTFKRRGFRFDLRVLGHWSGRKFHDPDSTGDERQRFAGTAF